MEIVQKKSGNKHTFTFNDDYFNFAYQNKSGSGDIDFDYADIPKKSSIQIEQNHWLKNVGFLWMGLGVLQVAYSVYQGVPLKILWLTLGALVLFWSYFTKVKYTVLAMDEGSIFVIQDKKHDQIMHELNSRKKIQLLQWYGDVNAENEFEKEKSKFNWLVDQGVMSKQEAEQKIAQLEFMQHDDTESPDEYLN